LQGINSNNSLKRALLSKIVLVTTITTMMFLVLVSPSFQPQQQAEASAYGLGDSRVPPAYIVIDGKASKLQLENEPMSQDRIADYGRAPREQYRSVNAFAS
jgi:hypothetical protein